MSIIETKYGCDFPGCNATVEVGQDSDLNDLRWERRFFLNGKERYHVCPQHRFLGSMELLAEIEDAKALGATPC